jgi:ferredoxin-thioredoxin reductase catalytic subunit
MSNDNEVSVEEVDSLYERLLKDAETSGYHLNPDVDFARELIKSLIVNQRRYGYSSCPCRLATGNKGEDADIICPCDYRDPDLNEYDTCYCALYVSQLALKGEKAIRSIPERRLSLGEREKRKPKTLIQNLGTLPLPVWRCKVCGYLCAREQPPEICPICKAKQERFERFI